MLVIWYVPLFWQAEQLLKLPSRNEVKLCWHIHTLTLYCLIIVRQVHKQHVCYESIHCTCMCCYCCQPLRCFLKWQLLFKIFPSIPLVWTRDFAITSVETARHIKRAFVYCRTTFQTEKRPFLYITFQSNQCCNI